MDQADTNIFRPDYAVHPGMLLEQELEHRQLSQADFARRIARTPKLVSEIISGKNPIEPETAIQFERVLGIGADVWLRMEAQFRLHKARLTEKKKLASSEHWLKDFPLKELSDWGVVRKSGTTAEKAQDVLGFFGVASHAAFEQRYAKVAVHYRRSKKMQASRPALLSWLRYGELLGGPEGIVPYDKLKFETALKQIRNLTNEKIEYFVPKISELCNGSGVAFVVIRPFHKTCLSGAAFWRHGTIPVIQQSLRHKTNDHFWFTFFHEAAHIILHSSRALYADDDDGRGGGVEQEANNFATDILIGRKVLADFIGKAPDSAEDIKTFAAKHDIHPGIIVGMLQHHGVIPWSHLNHLKARYDWSHD